MPVWLVFFALRWALLYLFRPAYWLARSDLNVREISFLTFAGIRGCVTLIMCQAVVVELATSTGGTVCGGAARGFHGLFCQPQRLAAALLWPPLPLLGPRGQQCCLQPLWQPLPPLPPTSCLHAP